MVKVGRIKLEMSNLRAFRGSIDRGQNLGNPFEWFRHVQRWPTMMPVRKSLAMLVDGPPRERSRPKKTWMDVVKIDMKMCNLSKYLFL